MNHLPSVNLGESVFFVLLVQSEKWWVFFHIEALLRAFSHFPVYVLFHGSYQKLWDWTINWEESGESSSWDQLYLHYHLSSSLYPFHLKCCQGPRAGSSGPQDLFLPNILLHCPFKMILSLCSKVIVKIIFKLWSRWRERRREKEIFMCVSSQFLRQVEVTEGRKLCVPNRSLRGKRNGQADKLLSR